MYTIGRWECRPLILLLALAVPACDSPTAALPELAISTESLPSAVRGEPYAEAVHATGGDLAYTWDVVSGALPPGLVLTVDDLAVDHAIISGVPDDVGSFTFTLRLRSGDGQTTQREFTIEVHPRPSPLAINTPGLPPALVGGPYNVQLRADGGAGSGYTWQLVSGTLPTGLTLTSDGRVQGTPSVVETTTFTVEVRSGTVTVRSTFTLQVVPHVTGAFRITIFAVTDIPPAVQPHVAAAVAQWERAIIGNLPAITVPQDFFGANGCGGFGSFANGTTTDDILIMVNITEIDGPGAVLGQAGPCGVRQASTLPFIGILTLDVDDLMPIVGTETLTDVIAHEIAHVLGFGALWNELGLLQNEGGTDPRFTGARATAEYQALGGTGAVPLETQGGEGTRDSHWRKSVFNIEMMTGFVEPVGIDQPVSRVTIAQWQDMGYTVNLAAADAFVLTQGSLRAPGSGHDHGILGYDEVYRGDLYVLDAQGRATILRQGER
jgi:hypothetical protein